MASLAGGFLPVAAQPYGIANPDARTLGMGGIMSAKKVIMLAFGKGKADAVRAMVNGEIDPKCPASILQLHRNVTVLLDREAAAEL